MQQNIKFIHLNVTIKNIVKFFENQKVLDNVCFSVNEGELVGFLGPNGAGKSTLMKIITGCLPSDSGEVLIGGRKVEIDNVGIKKHIGYLPEHNPLYNDLYVKEHLSLAAGLCKIPDKTQKVKRIIELTGLGSEQHKKIGMLSKGFRQRVGLAQALIHDPRILILDEPTTGLHFEDVKVLLEVLNKLVDRGNTVLVIEHNMDVIKVADHIVDLGPEGGERGGEIIAEGSPEALTEFSRSYTGRFLRKELGISDH